MKTDSLNKKIPGPGGSALRDGKFEDAAAQKIIESMKSIGQKKPEEKHTLRDYFNSLETSVWLSYHDRGFLKAPKKTQKKYKSNHGSELKPHVWHPIVIGWSEKGRGFGEYVFWEENGKIHCDNECDSRETVKRILCRMVDQAIFEDEEHEKKIKEREEKKKQKKTK